MESKFAQIMNNRSDISVADSARRVSAEIIGRYFNVHLASASDDATHALLAHELDVLQKYKNNAKFCVSYFLGVPDLNGVDLPLEFIQWESNMKADVIESAISNPSNPPVSASLDDIFRQLANAYEQRGYDLNDLANVEQIGVLPAFEGCEVAIKFTDVLSSMPNKQASYIFKNLLYISQQQK